MNKSIGYFNSGPCLLLYVAKENCVADFCEFLGPFSREEFINMPGTYVYLAFWGKQNHLKFFSLQTSTSF
jgi:hypothetical protein